MLEFQSFVQELVLAHFVVRGHDDHHTGPKETPKAPLRPLGREDTQPLSGPPNQCLLLLVRIFDPGVRERRDSRR